MFRVCFTSEFTLKMSDQLTAFLEVIIPPRNQIPGDDSKRRSRTESFKNELGEFGDQKIDVLLGLD